MVVKGLELAINGNRFRVIHRKIGAKVSSRWVRKEGGVGVGGYNSIIENLIL